MPEQGGQGAPSSSAILQFWNYRLKEMRSHRKDRRSRILRILPQENTEVLSEQQTQLPTHRQDLAPRRGRPGEETGRGLLAEVALEVWSVPNKQASKGHLGNTQGSRGKGPSRRERQGQRLTLQGADRPGESGSPPLPVMFHHTHINTRTYLPILTGTPDVPL